MVMNILLNYTYFSLKVLFFFLPWLIVFFPPVAIKVKRLHLGAHGLSFLNLIFIKRSSYSERVLRHELTHYRQQRRYSPMGTAVILFWHYIVKRGRWSTFWIENEANLEMDKKTPLPKVYFWN